MGENRDTVPKVAITITWGAIFKILLGVALALAFTRIWRFCEMLLLALIVAVAFRPFVRWAERHRWPHWLVVITAAVFLFGLSAAVVAILVPIISNQSISMVQKLPEFRDEIVSRLPSAAREPLNQFTSGSGANVEPLLKRLLAWGGAALEHLTEYIVMLVLAIYFIADGRRVYDWIVAFLPRRHRAKMEQAAGEAGSVVSHYVLGNLFTSVLCSIYAFAVLALLHVPNAALLAVLAGIFDLLPIIGFFLFAIPATLMALTVSPMAALLVGLLYGAYHLAENYFIVPKVYGNRLRLSTLTVLVSCLVGALLAGVPGVLLILPLVACYPIVERIWLQPHLEDDTVEKHEQADAANS